MMTMERVDGVRFFKVGGVTRMIWMPKRGHVTEVVYRDGIMVLSWLGRTLVVAPFRPKL